MEWPILSPLTDDERAAVLAATRRRNYRKGETLFHEGDPADSLHLVEHGHLAVRVSTPDGDRVTLNVLSGGDIVGELSLLDEAAPTRRSATVLALEHAQTRVLSAQAFHQLCDTHPGVRLLIVHALAERIRELSTRLLEAMYSGLDRRVYRRLLELHHVFASAAGGATEIPLTQEQLADLVGGTRPSVNQVLQKLQDRRVIELGRGRIIVRDEAPLRELAGHR